MGIAQLGLIAFSRFRENVLHKTTALLGTGGQLPNVVYAVNIGGAAKISSLHLLFYGKGNVNGSLVNKVVARCILLKADLVNRLTNYLVLLLGGHLLF